MTSTSSGERLLYVSHADSINLTIHPSTIGSQTCIRQKPLQHIYNQTNSKSLHILESAFCCMLLTCYTYTTSSSETIQSVFCNIHQAFQATGTVQGNTFIPTLFCLVRQAPIYTVSLSNQGSMVLCAQKS